MFPNFPVPHFPPLQFGLFGADNSGPAFSSLAFSASPHHLPFNLCVKQHSVSRLAYEKEITWLDININFQKSGCPRVGPYCDVTSTIISSCNGRFHG